MEENCKEQKQSFRINKPLASLHKIVRIKHESYDIKKGQKNIGKIYYIFHKEPLLTNRFKNKQYQIINQYIFDPPVSQTSAFKINIVPSTRLPF